MQPLSLTSPSSSPLLPVTPSSPSLSTASSPSAPPTDLSSAFQLAQTRARQKGEQLDALHALLHSAIASTFAPLPPSASAALLAERRVERRAVARVVMPMVFKSDLLKRWKAKSRGGVAVEAAADGDSERLLREVLDEEAELHRWTLEERKDMLHFMLDAMTQHNTNTADSGSSHTSPPVSLVEAMEGSMLLYHALLNATQRCAPLITSPSMQ